MKEKKDTQRERFHERELFPKRLPKYESWAIFRDGSWKTDLQAKREKERARRREAETELAKISRRKIDP